MENLGHRDTENADKNVGNEIMLGHRDTKNADRLLGHRDIKNADNLGHRDTETVDMCGQTDTKILDIGSRLFQCGTPKIRTKMALYRLERHKKNPNS